MRLRQDPPVHLTYCLNVHPGESWPEVFAAVREKALEVRSIVSPDTPFGLGLRLGHHAAAELADMACRNAFREFLVSEDCYISGINGFPYGSFHGSPVKEQVYAPDWRQPERVTYTKTLAAIAADLPIADQRVGISTVPISFKPWLSDAEGIASAVSNLCDVAVYLASIKDLAGVHVELGLEPEPGCILETTSETIDFFNEHLFAYGASRIKASTGCSLSRAEQLLRRHIGVCFDACHIAIQFEDLAESLERLAGEGIGVSRVQLSAALEVAMGPQSTRALQPFVEPVYLHQVKARGASGEVHAWADLPDALGAWPGTSDLQEARVHFHVPLFWGGTDELRSTAGRMTPAFFALLRDGQVPHLEIETYTYDVLPATLHGASLAQDIAKEYTWVLEQLG